MADKNVVVVVVDQSGKSEVVTEKPLPKVKAYEVISPADIEELIKARQRELQSKP